jgi:two-component system, chemotaxis family, sensor kinase CheA
LALTLTHIDMKIDELKEIFLAEALDSHEELNRLFTELEKNHHSKPTVDSIFRITHTLKANAAGMGYEGIAELSHVLEDIFSEIKVNKITIDAKLFADLFKACDTIGALLHEIQEPSEQGVKYKGLKTKLEVVLRNARAGSNAIPEEKKPKSLKHAKPVAAKAKEDVLELEVVDQTIVTEKTPSASKTEKVKPTKPLEEPKTAEDNLELLRDNKISFSDLVQIPVRKLDNLLNLVGELIIERDRVIAQNSDKKGARNNEFNRLQRITSELQYSVMDVRLVQVNVLFNKFHRIVRDTAAIEHKKVNLVQEGTEIEIDRKILQIISDSLIHLVRNAISHGIESPESRKRAGKPEEGTIKLSARGEKDAVIIEVTDDGKGIDANIIKTKAIEKGVVPKELAHQMNEKEIINLIFEPGFSSAEQITEVSGRGVGMDVVKKAMDSIGGRIDIKTELGKGSSFVLTLPSSMAVKGALLFGLSNVEYAIPLSYTESVIQLYKKDFHKVSRGLITTHQGKNVPVLFLNDLFEAEKWEDLNQEKAFHKSFAKTPANQKLFLILVSYHNRTIGLVVDYLLQQKEIVEKPLHKPLEGLKFVSGATILGNGNVCLVLDTPSIFNFLFNPRNLAI